MPNTREKLIELLSQVQDYGTKNTCEEWSVTVECKDNETVADHLIANGVTVQKWIPVTERLPEEGKAVLVCLSSKLCVVAWVYDGNWYVSWGNSRCSIVTHWMPLPEPPKGE